jgi:hypothetical protein
MNPVSTTVIGLAVPFAGTTLGAAMVFFMRSAMSAGLKRA